LGEDAAAAGVALAPQGLGYWGLVAEHAVPKLAWVAAQKKAASFDTALFLIMG